MLRNIIRFLSSRWFRITLLVLSGTFIAIEVNLLTTKFTDWDCLLKNFFYTSHAPILLFGIMAAILAQYFIEKGKENLRDDDFAEELLQDSMPVIQKWAKERIKKRDIQGFVRGTQALKKLMRGRR